MLWGSWGCAPKAAGRCEIVKREKTRRIATFRAVWELRMTPRERVTSLENELYTARVGMIEVFQITCCCCCCCWRHACSPALCPALPRCHDEDASYCALCWGLESVCLHALHQVSQSPLR
eukprot:3652920-Pyramimonas_sp.AAC.1